MLGDGAFTLNGEHVSYHFHVDNSSGDLLSDHFGGMVMGEMPAEEVGSDGSSGWVSLPGRVRREFPDQGRGDFRTPAIRIRQTEGYTVSDLRYQSYSIVPGKPSLPGLPATMGTANDASTLIVHLYDEYSAVAADLSYTTFPKYDAIVRSVNVTNLGTGNISVENLASFSVDFPYENLEMISLRGDWGREASIQREKVQYGVQR